MRCITLNLVTLGCCIILLCSEISAQKRSKNGKNGLSEQRTEKLLQVIRKLAVGAGHPDPKNIGRKKSPDVCYTEQCLNAAIDLMEAIDFKADPCNEEGFGEFACHRRLHREVGSKEYRSPYGNQSQVVWMVLSNIELTNQMLKAKVDKKDSKALRAAKIIYNQCINLESLAIQGSAKLRELSDSFGGWAVLTGLPPNTDDWSRFAGFLSKFETSSLLFDVQSQATDNGYEIYLDKGTILTRNVKQEQLRLETLLKSIAVAYKDFGSTAPLTAEEQNLIVSRHFDKWKEIKSLVKPGLNKPKKRMTIAQLNDLTYGVDWLTFFTVAFEESHVPITENTIVHVNKDYVTSIAKAGDYSRESFEFASILQAELFYALHDVTSLKGVTGWNTPQGCYNLVTKVFGAGLSREFLNKFGNPKGAKEDIQEMMDSVHEALRVSFATDSKLTPYTNQQIIEKFKATGNYLGYPKWLDNRTALAYYHDKLEISQEDDKFLHNTMNILSWMNGITRDGMEKEIDNIHYWELNDYILDANGANYHKLGNSLRVPSPFTMHPVYEFSAPGFVNYGSLATVMSHELGHGLDVEGHFFNQNGNKQKTGWWDKESLDVYNDWVHGIEKDFQGAKLHYHGPKNPNIPEFLPPGKTTNDDIADLIGLEVAFSAYKYYLKKQPGKKDKKLPGFEHISGEKLFFVRYSNMWCEEMSEAAASLQNLKAQSHSPAYTRATVPLKRSKKFSKTFGCTNFNHTEFSL